MINTLNAKIESFLQLAATNFYFKLFTFTSLLLNYQYKENEIEKRISNIYYK